MIINTTNDTGSLGLHPCRRGGRGLRQALAQDLAGARLKMDNS